jgi:hypothetical protein
MLVDGSFEFTYILRVAGTIAAQVQRAAEVGVWGFEYAAPRVFMLRPIITSPASVPDLQIPTMRLLGCVQGWRAY